MIEQHPQLLELPSTLIGAEEIDVRILKGRLEIDDNIRNLIRTRLQTRFQDEEFLASPFLGGQWRFQENGQFLFIPSTNANVGSELFPIAGTYCQINDRLEFQGQGQSTTIDNIFLDGSLYRRSEQWITDFLYTSMSSGLRVAQISQMLSPNANPEFVEIEDFIVPSTFSVQLTGQVDGQRFEKLAAKLKLQVHQHPQNTNPCVVRLNTDSLNEIGRFLWSSFEGTETNEGQILGTVQIKGSQAHIKFHPNQLLQIGMTWETRNTGNLAELLPTVGVDVQTGMMNFAINDDQITGSIQASGRVCDVGGGIAEQISNYEAQFIGRREVENWNSWLEALSKKQVLGNPKIEGDSIPVPAVFDTELHGATDGQSFEKLFGTLMIQPRMSSADPNPFFVMLSTNHSDVQQNGWLYWLTFNSIGELQELESRVFVEARQVRLEVESSKTGHSLIWKTLDSNEQEQLVYIDQGVLTFTVEDEQLWGEIDATGFTLDDRNTAHIYHAQISGRKQRSQLVDELRSLFNSSSLEGIWETETSAFGTLDLKVVNQQVEGTYTALNSGIVIGTFDTDQFNFQWRAQQAEGTGWARVLGNRGIIVGGWREPMHSCSQFFVGTRRYSAMLEASHLTNQDADELKGLGFELWLQGRGELAIPFLERVLDFHQSQPLENSEKDFSPSITAEEDILNLLIQCEVQANQYDRLPQRLQNALKLVQLRNPQAFLKQWLEAKVDEISNYFMHTLNQLEEMKTHLQEEAQTTPDITDINIAYSLLAEHLEELKNQLEIGYQEIRDFKGNLYSSQESDLRWVLLADHLENQHTVLRFELDLVLQRQKNLFHQETELLDDLDSWLQAMDIQALQKKTLTTAFLELNAIETRIQDRLSNHLKMANLERGIFRKQFVILQVLIGLINLLEISRNGLVRQEESNPLSQLMGTWHQSMIRLSEHMEAWRNSLVKEVDKIEALARGQSFFQSLIPLLFEFKAFQQALITTEKAKTRSFADLLATQVELQLDTRQIFATNKMLLSLAKAPAMQFQEIIELLKI